MQVQQLFITSCCALKRALTRTRKEEEDQRKKTRGNQIWIRPGDSSYAEPGKTLRRF